MAESPFKIPTFPPENLVELKKIDEQVEEVDQRHAYWEDKAGKVTHVPTKRAMCDRIALLEQRIGQLENGQRNMLLLMRDRLVAYHQWTNSIKREVKRDFRQEINILFGRQHELIDEAVLLLGSLAEIEPMIQTIRDEAALQQQFARMEKRDLRKEVELEDARRKALIDG